MHVVLKLPNYVATLFSAHMYVLSVHANIKKLCKTFSPLVFNKLGASLGGNCVRRGSVDSIVGLQANVNNVFAVAFCVSVNNNTTLNINSHLADFSQQRQQNISKVATIKYASTGWEKGLKSSSLTHSHHQHTPTTGKSF